MVNWKELPKIDAHIHLLPNDVIRANSGCGDPFVDYGGVSDYLSIMKEYNIECAFVMPFNDPYMMSMDFTIETVHSNLQQIATVFPKKYIALLTLILEKTLHKQYLNWRRYSDKKNLLALNCILQMLVIQSMAYIMTVSFSMQTIMVFWWKSIPIPESISLTMYVLQAE